MNGIWIPMFAVTFVVLSVALFYHYVVRLNKAADWLSKGAILVDVDSASEFALRHPSVALSLPLADLARRANDLGSHDVPVVVFAHTWLHGARATHDLHGLGFRSVLNAAGMRFRERLTAAAQRAVESRGPSVQRRVGRAVPNEELVAKARSDEAPTPSVPPRGGSVPGALDVTFGRILVPVDYSEGSRLALRMAFAIERVLGSEVHLFHLADVGADDRFIAGLGGSTTTPAELVEESKARLVRFADHVCPGHPAEVFVHADAGLDIAEGIERVAKEVGATLVLVARGPTGSVFRTHVEKVARQVDGAVLLL